MIPTEAGYAAFIQQFSDYAKSLNDIKLINTSLKGAQIDGFENVSLAEAVKDLTTIDKSIPKIKLDYDIEQIKEHLLRLENNLKEYKNLAEESCKTASRINMDWKRHRTIDKNLLLKIRALIETYTKMNDVNNTENEIFRYATAQYEMELNSFLKTIKNYDMTTTPQVITKLNEYYTLIQKRIDVISYWLNESMKGIC